MKVRWLGHSCIEILGKHHILIDPDYQREPLPDIDYIFITHGHGDHLGKAAEIPTGIILASRKVCEVIRSQGVAVKRMFVVEPGDVVENVRVLKGYSLVSRLSDLWARLWGRKRRGPGGQPLSFLVEDDTPTCSGHRLSLLHPGDGYKVPEGVNPDIFCLPYRSAPFWSERFKQSLIGLTERLAPKYVIPIHFDIPPWEANPEELRGRVSGEVIVPTEWVEFT